MQPVLQPVCTRALAGTGIAALRAAPSGTAGLLWGWGTSSPGPGHSARLPSSTTSKFHASVPVPSPARSGAPGPARPGAAQLVPPAELGARGTPLPPHGEAPAQGRLSRGPEAGSETSQEEEQVTLLWVSEAQMLWVPQGTQAGLRDRGGTQQSFLAWVWCNLHMQMSLDWP